MTEQVIKVFIADRPYRMKVAGSAEESSIRKAAIQINEKVEVFSKSYYFKDKQDLLAMIALQAFGDAGGEISQQSPGLEKACEKLKKIELLLDSAELAR
ncbi:MAG: cell division protein ZapA [Bacteroidota bacterium]